jgi:hypothetical protein
VSGNEIPTRVRAFIRERDQYRCVRCAGGAYLEIHHRQRRGIGADPHAYCNLLLLDMVCHKWAHAHPEEARELGFIVSMYEDFPEEIPVSSFMGKIRLACDGGIDWVY